MSDPVVHAISVVRNEADIIRLCLEHASGFCRRIWVLDNDSDDGTWDIVRQAERDLEPVVAFEQRASPHWGRGLHAHVLGAVRGEIRDGDWILILDGDEFQETDPRPALARAQRRGCDHLQCLQAQFFVTERDLEEDWFNRTGGAVSDFGHLPAHYRIDWMETRFFRFHSGLEWPSLEEDGVTPYLQFLPFGLRRRSSQRPVNRHYQYRSKNQMIMRATRLAAQYERTGLWAHARHDDWRRYVQPSRRSRRVRPGETIRPRSWTVAHIQWRRNRKRWKRRWQKVLRAGRPAPQS